MLTGEPDVVLHAPPYGSKGIGTLYVGDRAYPQLQTRIYGGEHARGLLSCTLAPHQIVAGQRLHPRLQ